MASALNFHNYKYIFLFGLLAALVATASSNLHAENPVNPKTVVVIYNSFFPGSEDLARYYAKKRGIPENNLIGLACSKDERIPRQVYEDEIAAPLRRILTERGLWKVRGELLVSNDIRYIVTIRGIPLAIKTRRAPPVKDEKRDPIKDRDEASVDSELTLLGITSATDGYVENPYYKRFSPFAKSSYLPGMMLVTRLDGPNEDTVRGIIDDTLAAERDGLWGWAAVDLRGIKSGSYKVGDEWLRAAALEMQQSGIPLIFDAAATTFPAGFPLTNLSVYYGWYTGNINGPFASGDVEFSTGAIALHIHSFSAATVRSSKSHWVGPLLSRGAAAVVGNVFEPYLALTTHPDIMQQRLLGGMNFADSAYAATPVLSWMTVFIGDPLYRPYGASYDTSLSAERSKSVWGQYQNTIYSNNRDVTAAANDLKLLANNLKSPVPLEALAWAQLWKGETTKALTTIDEALEIKGGKSEAFRLRYIRARLLVATAQAKPALSAARALANERQSPSRHKLATSLLNSLLPKPSPTPGSKKK